MNQVRRTAFLDGKRYESRVEDAQVEGDIVETDDGVEFDVVLAQEIVQKYRDRGKVYKPAEELEKAADVSGSVYLTDGHPQKGVVQSQDQVYGVIKAEDLVFDGENAQLKGKAQVFEDQAPDGFIQGIQDGERDSVSIGFYTQVDEENGEWNDEEYDAVQRNILLDHLAILKPDQEGRCSTENGCGIRKNMDNATRDLEDRDIQDAEPEDVSEGDKCRWDSSGGTAYGVVDTKETDGTVTSSLGSQEMEGTEDDPAFLMELYDYNAEDDEWMGRGETVVHRAGALTVLDEFPETDIALQPEADSHGIARDISELGYEVTIRDCTCGDHESHIILSEIDESTDGYKRNTNESKGSKGANENMTEFDSIEELESDQVREHPYVQDLLDEKQELEDRVEELEDQLEEIREEDRQEIKDQLVDDYGLDEEDLEGDSLEDLETRKQTLDQADLEQKDVTGTNPGQANDEKSNDNSTVASGGSGPYSDRYGDGDEE